jgi:hypothetical protein
MLVTILSSQVQVQFVTAFQLKFTKRTISCLLTCLASASIVNSTHEAKCENPWIELFAEDGLCVALLFISFVVHYKHF